MQKCLVEDVPSSQDIHTLHSTQPQPHLCCARCAHEAVTMLQPHACMPLIFMFPASTSASLSGVQCTQLVDPG